MQITQIDPAIKLLVLSVRHCANTGRICLCELTSMVSKIKKYDLRDSNIEIDKWLTDHEEGIHPYWIHWNLEFKHLSETFKDEQNHIWFGMATLDFLMWPAARMTLLDVYKLRALIVLQISTFHN